MGNAGLPETRTCQVETRHGDARRSAGMKGGNRKSDLRKTAEPAFPARAWTRQIVTRELGDQDILRRESLSKKTHCWS
ncbi:uncharacterized protein N7458_012231 [Penicillium daleae]|uniref:Uncharacterized protein n=1 Tax=Penicillium daleae TaxID=63821 RepID=A0AAD6BW72_9EURO|nr:uncharacterized protein N7458_012231 [Penicillium daleae]KAJ5433075.1 hypothetical protein N7458_012231 [Penicillium daleae]